MNNEDDIKLCFLDTSLIDTSDFFGASELLRAYDIANEGKLRHEYYTTEYLLHGKLDIEGSSRTVSLSELRKEGLFDLMPELDDEQRKPKLWSGVNELRKSVAVTNRPISVQDGSVALWIGSLFAGAFTMPMMVALLSLRRRALDDERFLRVVRELAGRDTYYLIVSKSGAANKLSDPKRDFTAPHWTHSANTVNAPEVINFERMMSEAFYEMRKLEAKRVVEVDELEVGLSGLSVASGETSQQSKSRSGQGADNENEGADKSGEDEVSSSARGGLRVYLGYRGI